MGPNSYPRVLFCRPINLKRPRLEIQHTVLLIPILTLARWMTENTPCEPPFDPSFHECQHHAHPETYAQSSDIRYVTYSFIYYILIKLSNRFYT